MMNRRHFHLSMLLVILFVTGVAPAFADDTRASTKQIVTFIELGSVNCIPCKAMQPIM